MILPLYKLRGTPEKREAEKPRLDRLYAHRDYLRLVGQVETNVKDFHFTVEESPLGGNGVFCMHGCPKDVPFAFYPGTLSIDHMYHPTTDARYAMNVDSEHDFVINGRPSRDPQNGANLNHSCRPNCVATTRSFPGCTPFILFKTLRPLRAGEEATFNYNADSEYWTKEDRLGPAPAGYHLVLCKCAGDRPCPNRYVMHERN